MSAYEVGATFQKKSSDVKYPRRPEQPRKEDYKSYSLWGQAMDNYKDVLVPRYNAEYAECRKQQAEIEQQFVEALGKELGIGNHPKYPQLYRIAYEQGHSAGFTEIAIYAEQMAELLTN
jgi:hypothetical protein